LIRRFTAHLLLAAFASGCCAQGPDIFTIWTAQYSSWSDPISTGCNWGTITWGGTTEVVAGSSILTIYQGDDDDRMRADVIEVWDGNTAMNLATETDMDHSCQTGCPSPRTLYRLDLPPGTYTLVHRRSRGTGKAVHTPGAASEDPWTTFDGEPALTSELVVIEATTP